MLSVCLQHPSYELGTQVPRVGHFVSIRFLRGRRNNSAIRPRIFEGVQLPLEGQETDDDLQREVDAKEVLSSSGRNSKRTPAWPLIHVAT